MPEGTSRSLCDVSFQTCTQMTLITAYYANFCTISQIYSSSLDHSLFPEHQNAKILNYICKQSLLLMLQISGGQVSICYKLNICCPYRESNKAVCFMCYHLFIMFSCVYVFQFLSFTDNTSPLTAFISVRFSCLSYSISLFIVCNDKND